MAEEKKITLTAQYQLLASSEIIVSTNGNNKYKLLLYAKTNDDLTRDVHKVSVKLILGALNSGTFYKYATEAYAKVNGTDVFNVKNKPSTVWELGAFSEETLSYESGTVIGVGSIEVAGATESINVSGYFKFSAASSAYYTPASGTEVIVTKNVELSALNEATKAVLSSYDFKYGDKIYIHLGSNDGYTHKLSYVFNGSEAKSIAEEAKVKHEWDTSELASLALDVPEASGYIVCSTYLNGTYIGTQNTSFRACAGSDLAPEVEMEISYSKSLDGLYLQNVGILRANFEDSRTKEGATIERCSATITYPDGTVVTRESNGDRVTIPNSKSGEISIVGKVVDSRGLTSITDVQTIRIEPYYTPYIKAANGNDSIKCCRWIAAEEKASPKGKSIRIEAARAYCSVLSGETDLNNCKLEYRYTTAGSGYGDSWTSLLDASDVGDCFETIGGDVDFSNKENYYIQLKVTDAFSNSYSLEFLIPAEDCLVHLSDNGKSIGFGQYASDESGRADFALVPYFNSGIGANVVYDGNGTGLAVNDIAVCEMDLLLHTIFVVEMKVSIAGEAAGNSIPILMIRGPESLCSVARDSSGYPFMTISYYPSDDETWHIWVNENNFCNLHQDANYLVTKMTALL